MFRRHVLKLAVATAAMLTSVGAQANDKSIQVYVGFAAGGSSDGVARVIAEKLSTELNRTVVVENRTGAIGRIAIDALVRTPKNQSAFLVAPFSSVLLPALTEPEKLSYDIFKDIRPVASLTSYPLGVAVGASTGLKSVKDLQAWLKDNPNQAQFGTAGVGGHNHFLGLQLGKALGIDMQVVGYKGNGPLLTDLMAGHVPMGVLVAGEVGQHIQSGRMNLIGVLSPERSPLMPDVPTFVEQGVNIDSGMAWYGMWAPATATEESVKQMEAALKTVLAQQEVQDAIAQRFNMEVDFRSADETSARLKADHDYWAPVIKASGFKPM